MMMSDNKVGGWVKKGQNHDDVILECPLIKSSVCNLSNFFWHNKTLKEKISTESINYFIGPRLRGPKGSHVNDVRLFWLIFIWNQKKLKEIKIEGAYLDLPSDLYI